MLVVECVDGFEDLEAQVKSYHPIWQDGSQFSHSKKLCKFSFLSFFFYRWKIMTIKMHKIKVIFNQMIKTGKDVLCKPSNRFLECVALFTGLLVIFLLLFFLPVIFLVRIYFCHYRKRMKKTTKNKEKKRRRNTLFNV